MTEHYSNLHWKALSSVGDHDVRTGAPGLQKPPDSQGATSGMGSTDKKSDASLEAAPRAPRGAVPGWVTKLPKGKKRGAGFKSEADYWKLPRLVLARVTTTEQSSEYGKLLSYGVEDFARGADRNDPDYEKGKPFFTARGDRHTAAEVKQACSGDEVFYRLMVSPHDGGCLMSRGFVREYMSRLERAIGCRLLWVAVIHEKARVDDPWHRHCHIIIRSRTFGPEVVRFSRPFIWYGFRHVAAELIASKIGPMTEQEMAAAKRRAHENACNLERKKLEDGGAPEWAIKHVIDRL